MTEVIQGIKGNTSGFDKTNRNTFFNHSSSAPSTSTVSLLTTTANCISKTITVLLTLVKLTPMAKNELLWWTNNLELCNDRLVIQPQTQILIQTYASRKSWRSCMSKDQNRGSVVQEGTGSTYQSAGTFNHKVCNFYICQNVENVSLYIFR